MSTMAAATTTEPITTTPTAETIFSVPSASNLVQKHMAALQEENMNLHLYNHMVEENIKRLTRNMADEDTISSRISSLTALSYTIVTTLVWKSDYKIVSLAVAACSLSTLAYYAYPYWRDGDFEPLGNNRGEFSVALLSFIGLFFWFFFKLTSNLPDIVNRIISTLLLVICISLVAATVISWYIFNEFEISQRSSKGIFGDIRDALLAYWLVCQMIFENFKAKMLWGSELLSSLLQNAPIL